ncbi:MAG TPA: extradiol dioxygenase [Candidatus Dormibacteraeota bacterium]|nr:extradiol dioxygenase [Candidatus Dormibacteraeota bacterium]
MITGTHIVIHTKDAEADRTFFKEVFSFDSIDAGHGWLIFALPPAEVAFHPAEASSHELYLMCADLDTTMSALETKGVVFKGPIDDLRWGRLAHLELPGGDTLGIYQPKHPVPPQGPITKD